MPDLDRPRRLNHVPRWSFSATPACYTPISTLPTRPGWYCCELENGRIKHLVWKCGSFWDDDQECCDVAYWVMLPPFVQEILHKAPAF